MIKANLIKGSVPGFIKTFDNLDELVGELERYICSSCVMTQQDYLDIYDPSNMSEDAREEFEYDVETAFPNDWKEYSVWSRMQLLLGTDCGCEMDVEFYDEDD